MDWIQIILGFITGGGLFTVISMRWAGMIAKVDAYSKMESFWQESNKRIRDEFKEQVCDLEKRITELEKKECTRPDCPNRLQA